jgi:hypothetical protein
MVANVLICTLIMWGLTAIAVVPLAKRMFAKAVASNPEMSLAANSESLSEEMKAKLQSLYNTIFIKADVLVMGIAGFIVGMAGFPMFGFAWKANAWPGLLALMGASFLSYQLRR